MSPRRVTSRWSVHSVAALVACSTGDLNTASPPDGARDAAPPSNVPPEANPISWTLCPFWGVQAEETGFGEPLPLGGVKICAVRRRGLGSEAQFEEIELPCSESIEGENLVLELPPMSEVVVTAEKEGYVPRVFAVTTGQWDHDTTLWCNARPMHLLSPAAVTRLAPGADLSKGALFFVPAVVGWTYDDDEQLVATGGHTLGGVTAALDPAAGRGPAFLRDGTVEAGASATSAGVIEPGPDAFDRMTGMTFFDLPDGEYAVRVTDRALAFAWTSITMFGFVDSQANVVRAPVWGGHYSLVVAQAKCVSSSDADTHTCVDAPADAGVR